MTAKRVTNGILEERISQLDDKFTERDENSRARLSRIEQLLQEMREQQIRDAQTHEVIMSEIKGVSRIVKEHDRILVGENHGMNKPGLVEITKKHSEDIAAVKKDVGELKEVVHAPERKFWSIASKVLDAAVIMIALGLLGKIIHLQ